MSVHLHNLSCSKACSFFGSFGFLVQFILAFLSFSALIFKRYYEEPRRSVNIFKFDAAKNGLGATLAHFINIFFAERLAGATESDPCAWYFIQILTDTTIVVLLNFLLLRFLESYAAKEFNLDITSGDYGDPPSWRRWAIQTSLWLSVVIVCKVLVMGLVLIFETPLGELGQLVLSPLCFNPHLELFIVVVLLPLLLNAFQFWVVDNFLMLDPARRADDDVTRLKPVASLYGSI
mmetsp:Transcript_69217/g.184477  ORF Transcript_69217/g.184477 Transcript_69217/m.184477 type:complete len:234 (+) Transcript_69217:81-782(+)